MLSQAGKRSLAMAVAATLVAGVFTVGPAEAKKKPNYASHAKRVADLISSADSDEEMTAALLEFFRVANVAIGGLSGDGETLAKIVGGYATGPQDLFYVEEQVEALARRFTAGRTVPISRLASMITLLADGQGFVTAAQAAGAMKKWIKSTRNTTKKKPTSAGIFVPRVVDLLANRRGLNLAAASPDTQLSTGEFFLTLLTLTPGQPVPAPTLHQIPSSGASVNPCKWIEDNVPGFVRSGVSSWIGKGIGKFFSVVKKAVGLPLEALSAVKNFAVAAMADVTLGPGSQPESPAAPLHWLHYDEARPAEPYKYSLAVTSGLPLPDAAADCLQLAGVDVPNQGGAMSGIPVIWWLEKGTSIAPEIANQNLDRQGVWEPEGPDPTGIPFLADLVTEVGQRIGDGVPFLEETNGAGVATLDFTPRYEEGPYLGAPKAVLEGKLHAFPLTAGLGAGVGQIAGNLASALTKNQDWTIKIEHHPKLGWEMKDHQKSFTVPGQGTSTTISWKSGGYRCIWPESFDRTWTGNLRNEQIPIEGLWKTTGSASVVIPGFPLGTFPWNGIPFIMGTPGQTALPGAPWLETTVESLLTWRRLEDTPAAGRVRLEYFWADESTGGALTTRGTTEGDIVPIGRAADLPIDLIQCETEEVIGPAPRIP